MNYQEAINFLFGALPMYQRVGKSAFKKDLTNTLRLCEALGNPQRRFKSIHVAGTNGKGSSSHMLASVMQEAGYKTGLYTSPHLKNFTERIKVNGKEISESGVVGFVVNNKAAIEEIKPSFFEMTVAMAFDYFARQEVDIAIIEVGLGGRLDSTNIISPEIALITNIGMDHTDMLGDTLEAIAFEKAGIIKPHIPVVIGETHPVTADVFTRIATERKAPLTFADQGTRNQYTLDLKGNYQQKNLPGVLEVINKLQEAGWHIADSTVTRGLSSVISNTGLKGRWQQLSINPLTICDTGHNKEGIQLLIDQMNTLTYDQLYLVMGFVNDKNVGEVLRLLSADANFIFCEASVPRAMKLADLKQQAKAMTIEAEYVPDVNEALAMARSRANENDLIFVGGSNFVVAELNEL
ncbi:MAG: bifunctional folylpolyglutamate synthase/dihydrofolate synthase [Roseivirga sp.]|nr:bifunctional folylpolyglutamate synthase/dihydrofolate synthase [Roseivirga sp.]